MFLQNDSNDRAIVTTTTTTYINTTNTTNSTNTTNTTNTNTNSSVNHGYKTVVMTVAMRIAPYNNTTNNTNLMMLSILSLLLSCSQLLKHFAKYMRSTIGCHRKKLSDDKYKNSNETATTCLPQ